MFLKRRCLYKLTDNHKIIKKALNEFNKTTLEFHHHVLYKAMGFTSDELKLPRIAVVNSGGDGSPGHVHLRETAEAVKAGIRTAGGMPFEVDVIGPCGSLGIDTDDIAHYDLPQRELICGSIEAALNASYCDGWIGLASCDKIVPAMLLAAIRLNRPCIIVPGGSALPGNYQGEWVTVGKGYNIFFEKYPVGTTIDEDDFDEMTSACGACPGTCSELTTGSSMQVLSEALGMSLPYSSTTVSVMNEHKRLAKEAGKHIINLISKNIRPSDIITNQSLRNAIKVAMAVCASTNTIIHFQALAYEGKYDLSFNTWEKISDEIPVICPVSPSGPYSTCDLHFAGGIPAVMKEISHALDKNCITVTGKTIEENIAKASVKNRDVILPITKPLFSQGSIKVLKGNIAEGAIVRHTVITNKNMMDYHFNAKVFNSNKEAIAAILTGIPKKIEPGDAIIIRYEGPRGGPAMTENYFLVKAMKKVGLKDIAVITDGRFSGFTHGLVAVGNIYPEAYLGGPLALIEDGDKIHVDIPNGTLNVEIDNAELLRRKENWKAPIKKYTPGVLTVYRQLALQANDGGGWPLKDT
jgi:dihydroxy-acid dehydratase